MKKFSLFLMLMALVLAPLRVNASEEARKIVDPRNEHPDDPAGQGARPPANTPNSDEGRIDGGRVEEDDDSDDKAPQAPPANSPNQAQPSAPDNEVSNDPWVWASDTQQAQEETQKLLGLKEGLDATASISSAFAGGASDIARLKETAQSSYDYWNQKQEAYTTFLQNDLSGTSSQLDEEAQIQIGALIAASYEASQAAQGILNDIASRSAASTTSRFGISFTSPRARQASSGSTDSDSVGKSSPGDSPREDEAIVAGAVRKKEASSPNSLTSGSSSASDHAFSPGTSPSHAVSSIYDHLKAPLQSIDTPKAAQEAASSTGAARARAASDSSSSGWDSDSDNESKGVSFSRAAHTRLRTFSESSSSETEADHAKDWASTYIPTAAQEAASKAVAARVEDPSVQRAASSRAAEPAKEVRAREARIKDPQTHEEWIAKYTKDLEEINKECGDLSWDTHHASWYNPWSKARRQARWNEANKRRDKIKREITSIERGISVQRRLDIDRAVPLTEAQKEVNKALEARTEARSRIGSSLFSPGETARIQQEATSRALEQQRQQNAWILQQGNNNLNYYRYGY